MSDNKKYTRHELEEWVATLTPGTLVLHYSLGVPEGNPDRILVVKKVTPTGIVRTNYGSYRIPAYGSRVTSTGGAWGEILPITKDLEKVAKANEEKSAEEKHFKDLTSRLRNLCYDIWCGKVELSKEQTKSILDMAGVSIEERTSEVQ